MNEGDRLLANVRELLAKYREGGLEQEEIARLFEITTLVLAERQVYRDEAHRQREINLRAMAADLSQRIL